MSPSSDQFTRTEFYYATIDCIEFFIDIYQAVGNQTQRGQLVLIKPADYRRFRQVLQSHWQFVADELQVDSFPNLFSDVPGPHVNTPDLNARLQELKTRWQGLRDVYNLGEDLTGGDRWSEREMLGCFNVECPCYGLKPLHKLRECKRCRTAHYCNVECQKK